MNSYRFYAKAKAEATSTPPTLTMPCRLDGRWSEAAGVRVVTVCISLDDARKCAFLSPHLKDYGNDGSQQIDVTWDSYSLPAKGHLTKAPDVKVQVDSDATDLLVDGGALPIEYPIVVAEANFGDTTNGTLTVISPEN